MAENNTNKPVAPCLASVLGIIFLFAGCGERPSEDIPEEVLQAVTPTKPQGAYEQVCMACHGEKGEGKEEIGSPSIAGLPKWYIEEQFRKFREGLRGAHMDDTLGKQMMAIAQSLTEEQIEEATRTVSEMPIVLTELPEDQANLEKGRYLFANNCMECHRYNGKGEIVFHSAQLIGLNRSYLRRQLNNFHTGKRGGNPEDRLGGKMVDVASRLTEEEIDILADYIGALAHGDDPRPARER